VLRVSTACQGSLLHRTGGQKCRHCRRPPLRPSSSRATSLLHVGLCAGTGGAGLDPTAGTDHEAAPTRNPPVQPRSRGSGARRRRHRAWGHGNLAGRTEGAWRSGCWHHLMFEMAEPPCLSTVCRHYRKHRPEEDEELKQNNRCGSQGMCAVVQVCMVFLSCLPQYSCQPLNAHSAAAAAATGSGTAPFCPPPIPGTSSRLINF
jgi:hypothetical protein